MLNKIGKAFNTIFTIISAVISAIISAIISTIISAVKDNAFNSKFFKRKPKGF